MYCLPKGGFRCSMMSYREAEPLLWKGSTPMPQLVELDARRRVALGRLGKSEHSRYLVAEQPDGTLVFTPAVVMTEHEAALLRHPELIEQIEADLKDPSRAVRSSARRPRKR